MCVCLLRALYCIILFNDVLSRISFEILIVLSELSLVNLYYEMQRVLGIIKQDIKSYVSKWAAEAVVVELLQVVGVSLDDHQDMNMPIEKPKNDERVGWQVNE